MVRNDAGKLDRGINQILIIIIIHTKLKNYYTNEPNIVLVMHGEIHRQPTASK